MCGEQDESVMHELVTCPEAAAIWWASPLRLDTSQVLEKKFVDWSVVLEKRFLEDLWWSLFWSLLWGIWLKRNAWCFEKQKITIRKVVDKAVSFVGEWEKANEAMVHEGPMSPQLVKVWKPPNEGCYKLNSDAALFGDYLVGFGGVARDYMGDVMVATCATMEGEFRV